MSTEQKALPCPFCGAVGLDFIEGSSFKWLLPSCSGCEATCGEVRIQTFGKGNKDQWREVAKRNAIEEWNTRTPKATP